MVYSGDREDTRLVRGEVAAMGGLERSKPSLHNFDLPFLKWGKQRHLRCMKTPDSDASYAEDDFRDVEFVGAADIRRCNRSPSSRFLDSYGFSVENARDSGGAHHRRSNMPPPEKFLDSGGFSYDNQCSSGAADCRRRNKPPPSKFLDSDAFFFENDSAADLRKRKRSPPSKSLESRSFHVSRVKAPRQTIIGAAGDEEGIEAVREKILLDLKTAARRMKAEILRKEESDHDDGEFHVEKRQQSPAPAAEARPWNLRTRRGVGGNQVVKMTNTSTAKLENVKREKQGERAKFAVALSSTEIEEDFREMVGRKPFRRPRKRPRNLQKQLDSLFPGLWLTEVTVDTYKVPELPHDVKR